MAWKFLNIAKANAEIERLEAELAKTSPPKQADAGNNVAALELKIEELSDTLSVLGDRISALEKASADTSAGFKVEIARLDKSISDFQASAKELGTRMAAEITARQGQAPLASNGNGTSNGTGNDLLAQHAAISDPKARMAFYRKNKAAYDEQFAAAQRK